MFRRTGRSRAAGADRNKQSGQALIELALVAPILILMLAGLVQFGLIFETQIGINNAIREAARRAATFATPDQATAQSNATWALGQAQSLLGNSQNHDASFDLIEVCIGPSASKPTDPSGTAQVFVQVKSAYRHPLFLPIVDLILDTIDGSSDRRLLSSNSTEFHVEQSGTPSVGAGGAARSDGTTGPCTIP